MSDGWDVVNEYADTVAYMVEEENKLKAEITQLRAELHHIRNESLVWAMTCPHDCPACDALYEAIKGPEVHPSAPQEKP